MPSWPTSFVGSRREKSRPDRRPRRPRRGRSRLLSQRPADLVRAHPLPAALRADRPRACEELPPRPGPARGGHLPGEQVPSRREVELGGDRAHAAAPANRRGHRHPHRRDAASRSPTSTTRRSTCATARGTCATCSTSTATRRTRSLRTTRASGTSTSGAPRARTSSSPRRARTSTASSTSRASTPGPTDL